MMKVIDKCLVAVKVCVENPDVVKKLGCAWAHGLGTWVGVERDALVGTLKIKHTLNDVRHRGLWPSDVQGNYVSSTSDLVRRELSLAASFDPTEARKLVDDTRNIDLSSVAEGVKLLNIQQRNLTGGREEMRGSMRKLARLTRDFLEGSLE